MAPLLLRSFAKAAADQAASPLFAIAAEIRNAIYEHVFAVDEEVPLLSATTHTPQPAILLCCQQANTEATGIYRTAHRGYWNETCFMVDATSSSATFVELDDIRDAEFRCIKHIQVKALHTKDLKPITLFLTASEVCSDGSGDGAVWEVEADCDDADIAEAELFLWEIHESHPDMRDWPPVSVTYARRECLMSILKTCTFEISWWEMSEHERKVELGEESP